MKYKYYIKSINETIEDARFFETNEFGFHGVCSQIAKYFYTKEDGWKASWPIVIVLFNENTELFGEFMVELEYEPYFYVGNYIIY